MPTSSSPTSCAPTSARRSNHFKQLYHSLDLLLIDDIQFFSRKDGTQEQFFYVFEALSAAKKQIIITSDTYPAEMQGIEERLVSRFGSGLTVAVEPPELEMRVAILLKKAERQGKPISDDVAFFVAKHSPLQRARARRRRCTSCSCTPTSTARRSRSISRARR